MNDSNLETLLRSWTPRAPSADLRRRLFRVAPNAARPAFARREQGIGWAPFIAATAAILMLAAVSQRERTERSSAFLPATFGAMVLSNVPSSTPGSNQFDAPGFIAPRRSMSRANNVWERATFDWTNGILSPLSIHSLPSAKTNVLIH